MKMYQLIRNIFYATDSRGKPLIKEIRIPVTADSRTVKRMIRDTFNIKDERGILKVCMLDYGSHFAG